MSQITTHILDTTRGLPAKNVTITLFSKQDDGWLEVNSGVTNDGGRLLGLLAEGEILAAGVYRMHFATGAYYKANNESGFYPYVDIVFEVDASGTHYHIPLLLTAYGYSTYRGS